MVGREMPVQKPPPDRKSALTVKEVQNFSPEQSDIRRLREIDEMSRAKNLGSTAAFENMVPNYANTNNTHAVESDFYVPQRPTVGGVQKPRPSTSQMSNKAPKRMVDRVKLLHNVVEYRPVTPGHITMIDKQASRKQFNKPTASSLQKYDSKVHKRKPQSAGKHR